MFLLRLSAVAARVHRMYDDGNVPLRVVRRNGSPGGLICQRSNCEGHRTQALQRVPNEDEGFREKTGVCDGGSRRGLAFGSGATQNRSLLITTKH